MERQQRMIKIRLAEERDFDQIWHIFQEVIKDGDTYVFSPWSSQEDCRSYLYGDNITTFVAEDVQDHSISGFYKLIANQRDLGSHVSNASFMVNPASHGNGVGRKLGHHCLEQAKKRGFLAMQFNFVVSTNKGAVYLWTSLGFRTVGVLPGAFRHASLGFVDALVMFRSLEDIVITSSPPSSSLSLEREMETEPDMKQGNNFACENENENDHVLTVLTNLPLSAIAASASSPELSVPKVHRGNMRKEGQVFKTWKNRFFILEEGVLSYYSSESESKSEDNRMGEPLTLLGYKVSTPSKSRLILTSEDEAERCLMLDIAEPFLLTEWESALNAHIAYITAFNRQILE